jgi:molecular chaperone GrpE
MTGKKIKVKGEKTNGEAQAMQDTSAEEAPAEVVDAVLEEEEVQAPQVLNAEQEEWKDRYVRLAADHENFKRRTEREMAGKHAMGVARALLEVLPAVDSFERSLAAETVQDGAAWREGVEKIYRQLAASLTKLGLERVPSEAGGDFDPNMHEVLATQPTAEVEPDKILHTYEVGYRLKDRLLRPAKVILAAAAPTEESEG